MSEQTSILATKCQHCDGEGWRWRPSSFGITSSGPQDGPMAWSLCEWCSGLGGWPIVKPQPIGVPTSPSKSGGEDQ